MKEAFVVPLGVLQTATTEGRQKPMLDSIALVRCLAPALTTTTLRQFSRIVPALLAMTGRVTMRGIARWTGAGGRYRTVQRFFATALPWASLFWLFFRAHLIKALDYAIGEASDRATDG